MEEPLGSDIFLMMEVGNGNILVRTDPDFRADIGTSLALRFNPNKLYFFDPKTDRALY
ncbi:MAG: hypothetical protein R2911_11560 [Caldilineaceae bacterium]